MIVNLSPLLEWSSNCLPCWSDCPVLFFVRVIKLSPLSEWLSCGLPYGSNHMSPLSKWLHVSLVRAITCPLCQSAHQVVPFVVRVSTNFLPLFPFFSPLLPLPYHHVLLCTTFLSLIPSCFFLLKSLLLSLPLPPLSSPLSLHPPCVVLFPLPPLPDTLLSLSLLFSARLLSLYFIFLFCIIILLPFSPLLGFYLSIFFYLPLLSHHPPSVLSLNLLLSLWPPFLSLHW